MAAETRQCKIKFFIVFQINSTVTERMGITQPPIDFSQLLYTAMASGYVKEEAFKLIYVSWGVEQFEREWGKKKFGLYKYRNLIISLTNA